MAYFGDMELDNDLIEDIQDNLEMDMEFIRNWSLGLETLDLDFYSPIGCEEEKMETKPDMVEDSDFEVFSARPYQLELYERARERNVILVLGTGTGKTYISILLIKEMADEVIGSYAAGKKRTVFVVNTVPLVNQQHRAIQNHTALRVGKYDGSMNVDMWDESKWQAEMEKHEVIVLTAEILRMMIDHNFLSLTKINLLIMDECHHATGNHPMKEVMRSYNSLLKQNSSNAECVKEPLPRILGMTACVMHKKFRVTSQAQVEGKIHELEITMNAALETASDLISVARHGTRPKECLICFNEGIGMSEYQACVKAQLDGIKMDINETHSVEEKDRKELNRSIDGIMYIMEQLGDWCVARAIRYEIEDLKESEIAEDVPVVRQLKGAMWHRLEYIEVQCVAQEVEMQSPENYVSDKVRRLIEILREYGKRQAKDVFGIIFVIRRNTAKILYDLLLEVAKTNPALAFMRTGYVVGSTGARRDGDLHLQQLELRKQQETLSKFRRAEFNFLVSTSVLEEGVDIRKCNVVIRFDQPDNFRAYVQSRGRARAIPSKYIIMLPTSELQSFQNDKELYNTMEVELEKRCHGRSLPSEEESVDHFAEDEIVPPYAPNGPAGAKVTFTAAISLVYRYCSKLPQDKFTTLQPIFTKILQTNSRLKQQTVPILTDTYRYSVHLPMNAPFHEMVMGDEMGSGELAKKSAAYNLCKLLHKAGEFTDKMLPVSRTSEDILSGLVQVPEEAAGISKAAPGTKKRQQIYTRELCQPFKASEDVIASYQLYLVQFEQTTQNMEGLNIVTLDSSKTESRLGFICQGQVVTCPFNLHFIKWGHTKVTIKSAGPVNRHNLAMLDKIRHFHKIMFNELLKVNNSLMEFQSQYQGVFVVPINVMGKICAKTLDSLALCDQLIPSSPSLDERQRFTFHRQDYLDGLIVPWYLKKTMYYVSSVRDDISAESDFKGTGLEMDTYIGYYKNNYNIAVMHKKLPLLEAKHVPKETNYLKVTPFPMKRKTTNAPCFLPELVSLLPVKASMWWQFTCFPSILHRVNGLTVAWELHTRVAGPNVTVPSMTKVSQFAVDEGWMNRVLEKCFKGDNEGGNLALVLDRKLGGEMLPFMILQALTHRSAWDIFDLERLELLGDAFLKFAVGCFLFLRKEQDHEGNLTLGRSNLTSNKTLYLWAKDKQLPEIQQSLHLVPQVTGPLPGFKVQGKLEALLKESELVPELWHSVPIPEDLEILPEVVASVKQEKIDAYKTIEDKMNMEKSLLNCLTFNPWTQHRLPDKNVADSVEALIGTYLLICGKDSALRFIHWLAGFDMAKVPARPASPVISNENYDANVEVKKLYNRYRLVHVENKLGYSFCDKGFLVQAFTHPSYEQNKVTNCYQRLEFLGDAILDYLVTCFIFSRKGDMSPGIITDLRSYYVRNDTLARVAANFGLQRYLLENSQKLNSSIDRFLNSVEDGEEELDLNTEDDKDILDLEDIEVPKALGDIVESLIGAVYLDSGYSLGVTWRVVRCLMGDLLDDKLENIPINCVRQAFELTKGKIVFIKEISENENAMCRAEFNGKSFHGSGKNHRVAKQAAAKLVVAYWKKNMIGRGSPDSDISH